MFAHVVTIFRANKCQNLSDESILLREHIYHFVFFAKKTIQYNPTKDLFRWIIQIFSTAQRNFELLRQSWAKDFTADDDDDDGDDETILEGRSHHR